VIDHTVNLGAAVGKPRVLVLEDEPLIAMMIAQMLDALDCECVGPIMSLSEGLERAKTEKLDAAILNLVIQGQKAYEVAGILSLREIPFGFASGIAHDALAKEWIDRPFLTKPFTIQDIASLLAKVLAQTFNPLPAKIASEIARPPAADLSHLALQGSEPPVQ
jgi:CheY-like chemotaxis protein